MQRPAIIFVPWRGSFWRRARTRKTATQEKKIETTTPIARTAIGASSSKPNDPKPKAMSPFANSAQSQPNDFMEGLTLRLTRPPEAVRVEWRVRALVACCPMRGAVPRGNRRDGGPRFGGYRESRDRDFPRAADLAKHGAEHALLSGGIAQTEHQKSPFSSGPNEWVMGPACTLTWVD
jgi:hypothetical protein